jgi:hypothetical protein
VDVGVVAGDDVGVQVGGGQGDDGVGDVAGGCSAHEFAGGVGLLFAQGVMSQPRSMLRSWTWLGKRLTWAMTGAGTTGMIPASSRTR